MKKTVFLFLLGVALTAFAFAIDGVGEVTLGTVIEANDINVKNEQSVVITPTLTFSRDLNEVINLFIGLNSSEGIGDNDQSFRIPLDGSALGIHFNKIEENISFNKGLGVGTFDFLLRNRNDVPVKPSGKVGGQAYAEAAYSLGAGSGIFTAGLHTGFDYLPAFNYNNLGAILSYAFDFGLNISTDTAFTVGKDSNGNPRDFGYGGTSWQIDYTGSRLGVGVEGSVSYTPGADPEIVLPIKPFVEYTGLSDGLTLGLYLKLQDLLAKDTLRLSPGLYASWTF
jgi:hypothetical protein